MSYRPARSVIRFIHESPYIADLLIHLFTISVQVRGRNKLTVDYRMVPQVFKNGNELNQYKIEKFLSEFPAVDIIINRYHDDDGFRNNFRLAGVGGVDTYALLDYIFDVQFAIEMIPPVVHPPSARQISQPTQPNPTPTLATSNSAQSTSSGDEIVINIDVIEPSVHTTTAVAVMEKVVRSGSGSLPVALYEANSYPTMIFKLTPLGMTTGDMEWNTRYDQLLKLPLTEQILITHGTHGENLHPILKYGLKCASGTNLQLNGAAYGNGVYFNGYLLQNYLDFGMGWKNSKFPRLFAGSFVARCANSETANPHYVLPENRFILHDFCIHVKAVPSRVC